MKCLYCGKQNIKEENIHLSCPICGNGMCEECYNALQGTDEQVFDISESIEDEKLYKELLKRSEKCTRLICYECIQKTINYLKEIDMKKAVKELKNFLINREYTFTIHLEDTPCDNYTKWRNLWVEDSINRTMKIYTGGSNHTIYDEDSMGATLNILARAWHDEYHYIADLDFSYEGEMRVQELQWNELKRAKLSEEAQLLFLLDMVGQTTFYQKSKRFLSEQNYTVNMWYIVYLDNHDVTVSNLAFETIKQRIKDIV